MSIASEITRLSGVRDDIFTSITNKGVTVPATATFSSCPALIDSITGGGGGSPTSLINDSFTASGFASGYRPFTATQNVVPLYDEVTGICISGSNGNRIFIQVPTTALSDASDLTDYSLILLTQTWNIDSNQHVQIIPDSANVYFNTYDTNITTNNFIRDTSVSPPRYYYKFNQLQFIDFWTQIQSQSWVVTAFTGEYVYIGWARYQQYENENTRGEWSYLTQTGTDIPYPTYSTTTTGFITNEISGKESFTGSTNKVPNIYVSGFKNVVYDDSPEGGASVISPSNINLTSFSSNMLKNNIAAKSNYYLNSTAYSYSYGSINSGYSGFEGI